MAIHLSVTIRRPSDEVFAYISDLGRLARWHHAIESVEKVTGGDNRTGATYRVTRSLPGGRYENRVSVTEFDPETRFTIESQPGPKPFAYRFRLAPTSRGTRVDVDASRDGVDLERAPSVPPALASALFQRRMAESLRRLKRELERERPAEADPHS